MKKTEKTRDEFSSQHADRILNQIITDSKESRALLGAGTGKSIRRYWKSLFPTAVAVVSMLVVIMYLLPGTVTPAPISEVEAEPQQDASSVTVNFQINSLVPLKDVSAQLNHQPVPVKQESYQGYSVKVEENGYLLLEVETITGKKSTQDMIIDSLDCEAPTVVSHEMKDGKIILYLSDGEGSGIDYEAINAYDPNTSAKVLPDSFSETDGYVAFAYPETAVYIEIPDKAGNQVTFVLQPVTQQRE